MLNSFAKIPRQQAAQTVTVAAPIGGWNARDALGAMDPLDAVTLTNFWPGTNSVILRNGYTKHATGLPAEVQTLMAYSSGTSNKLFAVSDGKIYDATSAGAVGAAAVSSLTNSKFQYTNITTPAASYLMAVNGADKLRTFDGTNWHKDGDGVPYDITNVDTATVANITLFKNRIWLTTNDTLKAWYLPVNSIGGAAVALDMTSIFQLGGYIMAGMTWTLDAGYGVDDYLVFITSNGEALVWRLTDPTTPTGISQIGLYKVGAPIGRRCYTKFGGDLLIITQDGVVPMSGALQSSRLDPRVSITNKIQFAMSSAISTYGANFGWSLLYYPKENQLLLNVPITVGTQQQYVMNNITKSWCNFTGWAANCWELHLDDPYFGGNGYVGLAWNGNVDDTSNIEGFGLQSFQSYGTALQKQCKMIRYHLQTDGSPAVFGNVNVDYNLADESAQLNFSTSAYGLWDTGLWDSAIWGAGLVPLADWQGATNIGYTFAPLIKTATQGIQLQWVATDLVFEGGGVL
tara:strand:+ start:220 stop:1767 length:1548 start_codon:yes stop_codon:yes gene_type:complete